MESNDLRTAVISLIIFFALASLGCAKGGGDPIATNPHTVLRNWNGGYYGVPLAFAEMELNEPNAYIWAHSDSAGEYVQCQVSVTFEGTASSGRMKTNSASILWVRPGLLTTKCDDMSNLDVRYRIDQNGFVIGSDDQGNGGLLLATDWEN